MIDMAGESQLPPETQPDPSVAVMDAIVRSERSTRDYIDGQIATLTQRFDGMERLLTEMDRRYEARFDSGDKAVTAALRATQEAVNKAEIATEKRFESVNEFRGQLADQAQRMMTRDESLSRHNRTSEQIADLQTRIESENRVARERTDNDINVLRDRHAQDMALVNSRLDLTQGTRQGMTAGWGYLVGAIGLAAVIIGTILAFN